MKSNGLLKWLMLPLLILLIYVGIKVLSPTHSGVDDGVKVPPLTAEERQALGIVGDTPRDTVATLVGQVKQLRNELQASLGDNQKQKSENERLRQREGTVDQRIQTALEREREQRDEERQQTRSLLQDLQQRLESLGDTELPIGLGLEDGDQQAPRGDGLIWIEPQDGREPTSKAGKSLSFPSSFGPVQRPLKEAAERINTVGKRLQGNTALKPVYTVPANATLMGSVAMTALIGRVPVDGTVNDPFPFKVLIGPDNLTANGIDLPDVAGAVVSGTASGDWTLSCVRGQIRSLTFVFQDGTVRTVSNQPTERQQDSDNQDGQRNNGNRGQGLGWISDPYGVPCVAGTRRSNAQQYLGSQSLITAAGAGVAALIQGNNAYISNTPMGTVGITTNEAMGRVLANGVQELSDWVNKLYGQAFAAVYVQPGAKVAVHIERAINVDYNPSGRRVAHKPGRKRPCH